MRVAFIIPCLNEEITIADVVRECRGAVPAATVYVFDNNSTDQTAARAADAGATVIHSPRPGKGAVVGHALSLIEADYYVMLDGDLTYPAIETPRLIALAHAGGHDMVNGARLQLGRAEAFRPLHFLGNFMFTGYVRLMFGREVLDLLTGFRIFSRRFRDRIQVTSAGFEVETELTVRALAEGLSVLEVPVDYVARPTGSTSKLRTFRDGARICRALLKLTFEYRPLVIGLILAAGLWPIGPAISGGSTALGILLELRRRRRRGPVDSPRSVDL